MKIWWLIVGIVNLVLAGYYFYLVWKSRQKISLKDIQIDRLPIEPFMPRGNAALEVKAVIGPSGTSREVRSPVFEPIINHANKIADNVQKHLNESIFPDIKKYLDDTSRVNSNGFLVAGTLSLVAAIVAFLSAVLIL